MQQEKHVQDVRQICGFGAELQQKHFQNNPPRITVSKLSANALVGKLGELIIASPNEKLHLSNQQRLGISNFECKLKCF